MISPEVRAEIRRLVLSEHWKIETVARRFGVHHSTVSRALCDQPGGERPCAPTALDPFKPFIVARLAELPELSCVRLLDELRPRGFPLGLAQLRRYVSRVRTPRPRKAYLRVEVEPGDQAQVDWGSFGHFRVGSSQRPLSVFSMVLSWSRALFIDFALDQKMETFLRMHRRALDAFGGVPRRILYDNLKSVVLHHIGHTVQFNPRFLAFAGHYLFEAVAAPVRYPEAKGRVEASIKYIRQSFFYGRAFSSLEDLRRQAAEWCARTANQRLHATTRERPAERLLVERHRLRALPERPFDTDLVLPLIVSKEARVCLDTNTYSVPPSYVGKTVHLRADDETVRILCDRGDSPRTGNSGGPVEIARHARSFDRRRHVEDRAHIDALLERKKGALGPKRRERLETLSAESRLYLQEIARRKIRLDHEVDKLYRLIDLYGQSDVLAAIAQALAKRTLGARYVRALCDQARFARGLPEPPLPIVTGNSAADDLVVEPHNLETYDALFKTPERSDRTDSDPDSPADK
ncbi:MAG: IS21 family transposase [Candidatus Eremiobacteraeota bacterium]|nr:IS21 family transposase [Candidatus Eremiobacteraeota bacterium]